MKPRHKKSTFCMSNMHHWLDGRCIECGDWDWLCAPRDAFEALFITANKPNKSHKRDVA